MFGFVRSLDPSGMRVGRYVAEAGVNGFTTVTVP